MMMNGRAFGGNLTAATPPPASAEGSLAGDAPEFVPGRPLANRARVQAPRLPNPPRARRMSKSQAPDMATRTHEDIRNGQYECVICTNEVLPNSRVWNCTTCWSVLHLSCVKKWSKNEVSTLQQRAAENGELPPPRQWRCPGCNLPKEKLPNDYTCWCEKEVDPRSVPGLPPHSCGQTCSKLRVGCPHPCELLCHAGPCLPCGHQGPQQSCFCGKEMVSKRCVDTNYDSGWSCGQVCGDLLLCGQHECKRGCHEGLCGGCEVLVDSKCFCGKVEKSLPCSEREDERESQSESGSWVGSFNCGTECKRVFDCGNPEHFCESGCHVQDLLPAHCPLSPDVVTHCPCGKTPLETLLPEPRKDCSEPVPHCKEECQKLLPCGHLCKAKCHEGECGSCIEKVDIACRCGRTSSRSMCHQGMEEPPCCARVCRSTMNCGRHECSERCCAGEKKASERQAAKRKHRAISAGPNEENIEAEHICVRVCGRPLKCGNHSCLDLCHKGPCRSCLEAIFTEVSCACGRTVLHPPQPCGVKPPECRFDCTRQRTCGHPQVNHQCHQDTESCPKCPFLVEKPCICGKKNLRNQPCWFTEVRCGIVCGKKLKCGVHVCQSLCHRGNCEEPNASCSQECGRKKTFCDHYDTDRCHGVYPCKEEAPCQAKTFITCACQNQKQAIKCMVSRTSGGNKDQVLECNDECLKLLRNAKLAAALNIDPATHTDDHIPYSTATLSFFSESTKFAQLYERQFRVFAADSNEKRIRFKPMQAYQRAFIHALAEDFGFDSESQDPEPHRHVCIFKTPRFVSAPMKTLAQCVKIKPVVAEAGPSKTTATSAEPWNALLLSDPKFSLTIDELHADLAPEFTAVGLQFEVSFLPSGDCVARAIPSGSWHQKVDTILSSLKPDVARKVTALKLASSTALCAVDSSLNVLRRDDLGNGAAAGGWSQVAKGGNGVRKVVDDEVGRKSSFTVLGMKGKRDGGFGESVSVVKKGKEKEKLVKPDDAVDDWEKEVEAWGDS